MSIILKVGYDYNDPIADRILGDLWNQFCQISRPERYDRLDFEREVRMLYPLCKIKWTVFQHCPKAYAFGVYDQNDKYIAGYHNDWRIDSEVKEDYDKDKHKRPNGFRNQ